MSDSATQQRVALIGIGSPFGDDILGWQLLDALYQRGLNLPNCQVVFEKADRPGPGLLERMNGHEVAVLVDALDAGLPPGSVELLGKEELATLSRPTSSHSLGVAETLALGETLHMLPANLYLLGIQMGRPLNPASVQAAAQQVEQLLAKPLA